MIAIQSQPRCNAAGIVTPNSKLTEAKRKAEQKLSRIIKQEGDAGGMRLEPWYLEMLVEESLREMYCATYTRELATLFEEMQNDDE